MDEIAPLLKEGKLNEIKGKIEANESALDSSAKLGEIYIQSLSAEAKPNWMKIKSVAEKVTGLEKKSSWGNYALGRYWSEGAKKTDLGKAIKFLGTAKEGKDPPPDLAKVYWIVMAKKYGMFLPLALLPIIVILKRKKKAPPKEGIPVEGEVKTAVEGEPTGKPEEKPATEGASGTVPAKDGQYPKIARDGERFEGVPPVAAGGDAAKELAAKSLPGTPEKKAPPKEDPSKKSLPPTPEKGGKPPIPPVPFPMEGEAGRRRNDGPLQGDQQSPATSQPQPTAQTPIEKIPTPASFAAQTPPPQKIGLRRPDDKPKELNKSEYFSQEMDLSAAAAEGAVPSPKKPELQPGTDVDLLWERLRRKASKQSLPLDQGQSLDEALGLKKPEPPKAPSLKKDEKLVSGGADTFSKKLEKPNEPSPIGSAPSFSVPPARVPDIHPEAQKHGFFNDQNLGLDLSDESLKDDLLGKMKMLAIEDGELRKLLLQRNPNHLPNLIEYTLMKPEPVKLAFLARELGSYHDAAVSDILNGLLVHEDKRVVLGAIQGLQANGFNQDLLNICRFIKSDVPMLAEASKTALSFFGPKRLMAAFLELPRYPDEKVRESGVFVLSRMSGKPVVDLLKTMLKDSSEKVRHEVILGMAFQKDPGYMDVLREVSRSSSEEDKKMARKAMVYLQSFVPKPRPAQR